MPVMTILPRGHAADLALTIPLANQANVAWTLAYAIRHHPNWAISINRQEDLLKRFSGASNPLIRRIAAGSLDCNVGSRDPGPVAA